MKTGRYVTIMLIPDGTEARQGYRIKEWLLRLIVISLCVLVVGIALFFSFYGSVLSRAAMTDQLAAENDALKRYQYKVQLLESNLRNAREIVSRLTAMAGIEYEFPEMPDDSILFADLDMSGGAILRRSAEDDPHWPSGLPMQGFITQDFDITDAARYHPGIDIACAIGTPVLATAEGTVILADVDSIYGNRLVIRHSDSAVTVYGHNDTLLVELGQEVQVGSRIALGGNTGKSSAPHLHYELRVNDKPINPLDKQAHEKN